MRKKSLILFFDCTVGHLPVFISKTPNAQGQPRGRGMVTAGKKLEWFKITYRVHGSIREEFE